MVVVVLAYSLELDLVVVDFGSFQAALASARRTCRICAVAKRCTQVGRAIEFALDPGWWVAAVAQD